MKHLMNNKLFLQMKIRLFDPIGIKSEDYRHRYPELERTKEFTNLHTRALMFVWWYANPTSPLVLDIPDNYERVAEALKKSQYTPSKTEKEDILRLEFNSDLAAAVQKMSDYDPGARFRAYKMVLTIFDEYEKLAKMGPKAFITKEEGEGEAKIEYIDYPRYVTTSTKITEELSSLLAKIEEGFGIADASGKNVEEEGGPITMRDWHMNKDHRK